MSEPKKKTKSENKMRKSKKTNNLTKGTPRAEKKKVTKNFDGIAISKQLAQKLQTRSSSYARPKIRTSNSNDELRLCGNGKPMPSLSELEKMFEDSEDDEENKPEATAPNTVRPSTPKEQPKPEAKLMSPTTISEIANRMFQKLAEISDPTELLEDGPPPPVIKPKKRRKPDKPYIDGCKDRPYVPERPCVKFCKGDDKYGPDSSEDDDDDLPKKRAKRGKKVNISKSIFNAKSDEIAARLKECDDDSSDSNKTVAYELYTPLNTSEPRSFSPLPSTSRDTDTFVKNDQRFKDSLLSENTVSTCYLEDNVEVIETPCETLEINDTDTPKIDGSIIEIADDGSAHLIHVKKTTDDNDLELIDVKPSLNSPDVNIADDSVQIVDDKQASPIVLEDYYSNLDLENIPNDDICEVIDVDDIIAENKALLEKYSTTSNLDTVTLVDTSNLSTSTHTTNQVEDKTCNSRDTATGDKPENNIDTNSRNISTSEQASVILLNSEEVSSHRPILVGNGNEHVDVEVIDDTNYHHVIRPQNTSEPRERNDNLMARNQPPNHPPPRYCHHLTGTVLRMRDDTCDFNCVSQESASQSDDDDDYNPTSDINSYQQQMRILSEFFKRRSRNGGTRGRKAKKKNPRLNQNIFPPDFSLFLQSMTNPNNNRPHINNAPSPMVATSNSPPKTSKQIGDCPICMDSLSNKPIASTICGHVFCMDCLKMSITSNGNKCPTCRKALKRGTGYHQIFL